MPTPDARDLIRSKIEELSAERSKIHGEANAEWMKARKEAEPIPGNLRPPWLTDALRAHARRVLRRGANRALVVTKKIDTLLAALAILSPAEPQCPPSTPPKPSGR